MPLRPLRDQRPNYGTLMGQLEDGEVLLARRADHMPTSPNAGAHLKTQKLFNEYMATARQYRVAVDFFALPERELPPPSLRITRRKPRR